MPWILAIFLVMVERTPFQDSKSSTVTPLAPRISTSRLEKSCDEKFKIKN